MTRNEVMQNKIEKGSEIRQELFQKYETILPYELMEIWKNYGFGTLLNGYLRVINPDEYQALLNETYFRGEISIPIIATAFGDIITLEEKQYIGMVKYIKGDFVIIAKSFKRFLQNLTDDYFVEKYF